MTARGSLRDPRPFRSRTLHSCVVVLACIAWLAGSPERAVSQALDANAWVTDGDVGVIVPRGNTVYIGGGFSYLGPNTGGWAELDARGHATTRLPRLDGDVTASVSDGAGGWFIGGKFTHVAGIARPGLARVLADGSVAAWTPSPAPAGIITSLEHRGTRLFVASDAAQLLAYDDITGATIGAWAPQVSGVVSSLAVNGTTLYAGGDLSFIITSTLAVGSGVAAINTSTGAIADWDPAPDVPVTRVRVEGRWLYVTGGFSTLGGQAHGGLARALLATRVFDSGWTPSVDMPVAAWATVGDGLWIGGGFFIVNGSVHAHIAVLDTTSGATLGLTPDLSGVDGAVSALIVRGPYVYVGLSPLFVFGLGGSAKPLALRLLSDLGTVDRTWSALGVGAPTGEIGSAADLVATPSGLLITGRFVSVGGRRQLAVAALDRATGIPREWDPGLAVDETLPIFANVNAILPTSHGVYLGGYFTHAGGQLRKSLAAIDSATGRAQPWRADLGPVTTLAAGTAAALTLYQDKLVVGGAFSTISNQAHASLAEVDTITGTPVAAWNCNVTGAVNCLLTRGTTVFVGGGFSNVGGQVRGHVAAIHGGTAAVLAWNPVVEGVQVQSFADSGDTLYIGGDFSKAAAQNRICLAAVSATSGALLGWAPSVFGPVRALAVDGANLIVGGEFQFIVLQPQPFLAWLDRGTGALATGTPLADEKVLALTRIAGSLYVGGSFGRLAQAPTANFGRVGAADVAGPSVTVVAANGGEYLVVGSTYRVEYAASDPSGVASVDVELARAGSGGPWTLLAAGVANNGHYDWQVSGPAAAATAFVRVTARDFAGNLANDRSNAGFTIGPAVTAVGAPPGEATLASFSLGPNPARLGTELRFELGQATRAGFRLLDVQGREVWRSPEQSFAAGAHALPCDLRAVRPGLYFMRFERGSESRTARLAVFR